jgi:hypothetical protein
MVVPDEAFEFGGFAGKAPGLLDDFFKPAFEKGS